MRFAILDRRINEQSCWPNTQRTPPRQSPQKEYGYRNGELLITAAGSSCGVGNTGPQTWLGTDGHLGHLTGHAEGTNWAVYAGSDSPTAMVYGPYDTTYGQGHHTAQFKLMVDNNSGSDVVASLDVVTGFGGNILATRQVRRSDFTAANQWQTFTLQFDNPCFGLFEARVLIPRLSKVQSRLKIPA
jgi:hypothetical protein